MYDKDFHDNSALMRGHVLSKVIVLETMMGAFLSKHFCKTKKLQTQILETIFATTKITFDSKRDAINAIMIKDYKKFLEENKHFNSDLQEISKQRNIFAHYPLNTLEKGKELFKKNKIVTFIKFKNSTDFEAYDIDSVNRFLKKVSDVTLAIINLLDTMKNE